MTRYRVLPTAIAATLILVVRATYAQTPSRSALEASGFVGYNRMVAPSVDHGRELSATNGGFTGSALLLYRSRHFLSPYLEVGYASIYSSRERVEVPGYGTLDSENSLNAWSLIFGPALDLGPVRLRGGIGLYRLEVSSTVLGKTIHPVEYDLGWFASIQGTVFKAWGIRFSPEVRALLISEASTATIAVGVSGRGDLLTW